MASSCDVMPRPEVRSSSTIAWFGPPLGWLRSDLPHICPAHGISSSPAHAAQAREADQPGPSRAGSIPVLDGGSSSRPLDARAEAASAMSVGSTDASLVAAAEEVASDAPRLGGGGAHPPCTHASHVVAPRRARHALAAWTPCSSAQSSAAVGVGPDGYVRPAPRACRDGRIWRWAAASRPPPIDARCLSR